MSHPLLHPANPDDLPLCGLQVLDFAQGVAGPHATMLLAQAGAEVIKIEPPAGDWSRTLGTAHGGDLGAHAIAFNRGKKSLAVDLKNAQGLALVRQMAADADVIVESFRPGVMQRFGLDYAALAAANPALVYLSVSGYGQSGPRRELPATDTILQAYTGWMAMNRNAEGMPQRTGMVAIDVLTGLYASQAIGTALIRRFRSGQGQYIDCSLLQSALAFQSPKIMEYHLEKGVPATTLYVPIGCFETADGFINISSMRDHHYTALCKAIERPDLLSDPRFDSHPRRLENEAALMAELRAELLRKPAREWAQRLTEGGVMNSVVVDYGELLADPHVRTTGLIDWIEQPDAGTVPVPRIPGVARIADDDARAHAPHVGEQTRAILRARGLADAEIERLASSGAIALRG